MYLSSITHATLQGCVSTRSAFCSMHCLTPPLLHFSCVMTDNSAVLSGGGWWVSQKSSLMLQASDVSSNSAGTDGGGGAHPSKRRLFVSWLTRMARAHPRLVQLLDGNYSANHDDSERRNRTWCDPVVVRAPMHALPAVSCFAPCSAGGGAFVYGGCVLAASGLDLRGNSAISGGAACLCDVPCTLRLTAPPCRWTRRQHRRQRFS